MNAVEIIRKKRDGFALRKEEIHGFIQAYQEEQLPDYQAAAWAMAIYYQGMNEEETAFLTEALVASGEQLDLTQIEGIKVDKHSTGGVGDTTTLIVAPMVAAEGVPIAKLSGRGLGHTGGTVDKLESIAGFTTEMSQARFTQQVNDHQIAIMGQTADLTPADKKLYALRDVTATVDSIPLIASSVMSKKIAAGADAILLDVKTGAGAFMKEEAEAFRLAKTMVSIGEQMGRNTVAMVSDMSQPLGRAVGNGLEVLEAVQTLAGEGAPDLTELCLQLGSHMLVMGGIVSSTEEAYQRLQNSLHSGKALQKLREWVVAQQGDPFYIDHPQQLVDSVERLPILSSETGWVQSIQAEEVGLCAMQLGAGRATKLDLIDHEVGIWLHKKVGDKVQAGEPLATFYVRSKESVQPVMERFQQAIQIGSQPVTSPSLIRQVMRSR